MHHALALAERALGMVAPNPAVGCVIVSEEGHVVGRGWTGRGGRPHAETVALAQAGAAAYGATAYVTLEPCAHQGVTPPCASTLIEAGVARVVAALEDPDPRVSGKGFAMLRAAGVEVVVGPGAKEAGRTKRGLLHARARGTPAGHAEDRPKSGWQDRHRLRRKPLDHGRGGAPLWASDAGAARRDPGRHRDGAGRRSRTHLPLAGA